MLTQHFPQNIKEECNPSGLEKLARTQPTSTAAPNKKGVLQVDRESHGTLYGKHSISLSHTHKHTHKHTRTHTHSLSLSC